MKLTEKYYDYLNKNGSDNELMEELGIIQEQGEATKYRKTTHSVAGLGYGVIDAAIYARLYKRLKRVGGEELAKQLPKPTVGLFAKRTAAYAAMWGAYRGIRAAFDKCTRKCGWYKINTPDRQKCLNACKAEALKSKNKK